MSSFNTATIILLFAVLLSLFPSQVVSNDEQCYSASGEPVSWWIILKAPPLTHNIGYAYYDSTMVTDTLIYYNNTVDLEVSALTQTLTLINRNNLERVAWNDAKPNNQTSTSKAHAKGIIAYGKMSGKGFLIVHSIPKYPAFLEDHSIFLPIPSSGLYYGQHFSCFSLTLYELEKVAGHLLISRPNVYEGVVTLKSTTMNLYDLSISKFPIKQELFQKYQMRPAGYSVQAIFKNNAVNGSIFEDGIVKWLKPGKIQAETWGRPLQHAWCQGEYEVKNIKTIKVKDGVQWTEGQDHSKWMIVGEKYACFGDMNRMESQWKRGGAYYCIINANLNRALRNIIITTDQCDTTEDSANQRPNLLVE